MENLPRDDAGTGTRTWSSAIRRYPRAIAATTLVFVALAIAYSAFRGQSYTSSATLQIRPLVGNVFSPDVVANDQSTAVAVQTEANLVGSRAVTRIVNNRMNSNLTPAKAAVAGTVPVNTTLITVTYTASSAKKAMRFATAYANAFLAYRTGQANAVRNGQLTSLTNQRSATEKLLAQATQAAQQPNPPANAALEQSRYAAQLAALQSQINTASATDTHAGSIVIPANHPHGHGVLTTVAFAVIGAILGFCLSAAFAMWRYRRRDEISARQSYGAIGDVPLLAVLPGWHASGSRKHQRDTDSVFDDAVRRARVGILASVPPPAVLAVCPVSSDESVTGLTIDLARSLAAAQYNVVVIDASLAKASVAQGLGLPEPRGGLAEALLVDPGEARSLLLHAQGFHILPGGRNALEAREKFSSPSFDRLIEEIAKDADYVLIAARSPLTGDGSSVIRVAGSTVLVATDEHTAHADLTAAAETSRRLDTPVIGVLVRTRQRPAQAPRTPSRPTGSPPVTEPPRDRPRDDVESRPSSPGRALAGSERAYATGKPASSDGDS